MTVPAKKETVVPCIMDLKGFLSCLVLGVGGELVLIEGVDNQVGAVYSVSDYEHPEKSLTFKLISANLQSRSFEFESS